MIGRSSTERTNLRSSWSRLVIILRLERREEVLSILPLDVRVGAVVHDDVVGAVADGGADADLLDCLRNSHE